VLSRRVGVAGIASRRSGEKRRGAATTARRGREPMRKSWECTFIGIAGKSVSYLCLSRSRLQTPSFAPLSSYFRDLLGMKRTVFSAGNREIRVFPGRTQIIPHTFCCKRPAPTTETRFQQYLRKYFTQQS